MATVPACLRGFLGRPPDFASRNSDPFQATFRSLLAILLSDLALRNRPEVRKVRDRNHYRSMGYVRTNQAIGLQHWVAEETRQLRFVGSCRDIPTRGNTDGMPRMAGGGDRLSGRRPDNYNKIIQDQSGGAP